MVHEKRDMDISYGYLKPRPVFAVSGWHCPACKECVFDTGEGMRCVETLEAMMLESGASAPPLVEPPL